MADRTPRSVFYTATTLDGFLADEHDSLQWLFEQEPPTQGENDYRVFIDRVGTLAMGSTTYQWLLDNLAESGEKWPYEQPTWVFTHREFGPPPGDVRFVSGSVAEAWPALVEAAGERDVWVVGGGDLAAQFAEACHLDELVVSIAPVVLGAGRPLFPRRWNLKLRTLAHDGDFAVASYDVVGPRGD